MKDDKETQENFNEGGDNVQESQSNEMDNASYEEVENSDSRFKVNKGIVIIGLIVFIAAMFALQKYVSFDDGNKSKKNAQPKPMPIHSEQVNVIPHDQAAGNVVAPPVQPAIGGQPAVATASSGTPQIVTTHTQYVDKGLSLQDKKDIEVIVKKYIENNPEIIAEALQNLNNKANKAREDKSKEYIDNNIEKIIAGRPTLGNPNGSLVIVEFFDYKCSYCRRSNIVLERVMKDYPDVKLVLEPVPVLGKDSAEAVRAALAVWSIAPNSFAKFHENLINSPAIDENAIRTVARKSGISMDALKKAMNSPQVQSQMNGNLDAAQNVGMRGVPTFIVAGELVPGSLSYESFQSLLDKAKGKAAKIK